MLLAVAVGAAARVGGGAFAGDENREDVAVACDEAVGGGRHEGDSGKAEEVREPAPSAEHGEQDGQGFVAGIDRAAGHHELHGFHALRLGHGGKALGALGGLAGEVFEGLGTSALLDPCDGLLAEGAFTVVYQRSCHRSHSVFKDADEITPGFLKVAPKFHYTLGPEQDKERDDYNDHRRLIDIDLHSRSVTRA